MANPQRVDLYVPRDPRVQALLGILSASAIVGSEVDGDEIVVDIEGDKYGAVNLKTYEGRVEVAVGRHLTKYPTTARRSVHLAELVRVGCATNYPEYGTIITEIDEPEALAAWLSPEPLPAVNGSAELRDRIAGKAMRILSHHDLVEASLKSQATGKSLTDVIVDKALSEQP